MRKAFFFASASLAYLARLAPAQDSARVLAPIVVSASEPLHVLGHQPSVRAGVIYAGRKTEVIVIDSLRANLARDVERQILGRIPGASFSETQGAGFPSNGVGFRGLDPTQSIEMNTRQNGVNIAADVYGYPETYYTPPSEALDRIEVVRGAGSLAFGPQVGGTINYVVRQGRLNTPATVTMQQTGGSAGLLNSFNAVSGGTARLSYYAFAHYRGEAGARPNSDYAQNTVFASTTVRLSDKLSFGAEFTRHRNRVHMPGGLSDAQFAENPLASFRARNWLASPWNVAVLRGVYDLARSARLETIASLLDSDRHLIWRNEDGGPEAVDDPATPREVERERFHNWTMESRLRVDHGIAGRRATLATGIRLGLNRLDRFEGGPGSAGAEFDMNLYGGNWERALRFRTQNVALFAEELVHIASRLCVTGGVRYENLRSRARGYTDVDSAFTPSVYRYPLFGAGVEYVTSESSQLYANFSQSYRPVLYASLTPFGSITRVDSTLRPSAGRTMELGWRGNAVNVVKFDVGGFYLWYGDRLGVRLDSAGVHTISGNIGNSVHRGVETYLELDPFSHLDVFASLAYIDARYVNGEFAGKRVELAPRALLRGGVTCAWQRLSTTVQGSYTGDSFGDASNAILPTDDAVAGYIPSYSIADWSGTLRVDNRRDLTFGVNNVANVRYFTKRTGEYPGPGILPGAPRSWYGGARFRF